MDLDSWIVHDDKSRVEGYWSRIGAEVSNRYSSDKGAGETFNFKKKLTCSEIRDLIVDFLATRKESYSTATAPKSDCSTQDVKPAPMSIVPSSPALSVVTSSPPLSIVTSSIPNSQNNSSNNLLPIDVPQLSGPVDLQSLLFSIIKALHQQPSKSNPPTISDS